jgi:adenine C2-methylase RlmN of 23S rRNA A2503 and tRNA A37
MKFFPLIWKNLWRKKARASLTILSVMVAFLLFALLSAIAYAFKAGEDVADAERLVIIDKVSLINMLPIAYQNRIASTRGVQSVTHATWFGGYYQELRNQFPQFPEQTNVTLAISLHAASEELRGRLMPVNRKYSLDQLIDCCRNLPLPRRKRITFEYVLLGGVNDSVADAAALCRLLRGVPSKVNLIPFNPHPGSEFHRPGDDAVKRFKQVLFDHKLQVNVRRPRGDDIAAACGQLQGQVQRELLTSHAPVAAN